MTIEQLLLAGVLVLLAVGVITVNHEIRQRRLRRERRARCEQIYRDLYGVRPKEVTETERIKARDEKA